VFGSVAIGLDDAPYLFFRLIGAKEARVLKWPLFLPCFKFVLTLQQIGLMIIYCAFIHSRNHALMFMTVIGRLRYTRAWLLYLRLTLFCCSTVPMLVWFVFGKGGSSKIL
jgi:hypothetical protein